MELPDDKRIDIVNQLKRLDYNAKWSIFSTFRSNAVAAEIEVTETLVVLFGREEADKLLVEAGINHEC